jgi:hypothetical protein
MPVISRLAAAVASAYGWGRSLGANLEYLVVAGGAGGGNDNGGGGGAGGYLTGTEALVLDTAFTVTVGSGGAGSLNVPNTKGGAGSNSVFNTMT